MTAITQKIRRFTGGISDQPDEQKIPGQVRDAVNCVPDVVQGLIKRPGMNLVNELDTDEKGKWFFIDKANNFNNEDRYVGQISNTTGKVKIWDLANGKLMDVCYTDNIDPLDIKAGPGGGMIYNRPEYAAAYDCEGEPGINPSEDYFYKNSPDVDDLQVLTINDYTFVTNRKVPVEMADNTDEKAPPQATVELRSIAGLTEYKLEFFEPTNVKNIATELTVAATGYNDSPPSCPSTWDSGAITRNGIRFRIKTTAVVAPTDDGSQCVYTTTVTLIDGGTTASVGQKLDTITLSGVTYQVTVQAIKTESEQGSIGVVEVTSARENPKADDVLDSLRDQIRDLGFTCDRIGNGLYITRSAAFTVISSNTILLILQ